MSNPTTELEDHDRGLQFDLQTMMMRRGTLAALGAAVIGIGGYVAVRRYGGGMGGGEATLTGTAADGAICVQDPVETEGPYPADGTNQKDGSTVNALADSGILREDIRTSFGALTPVAEGVQMDLVLTLVNVSGACAPLAGHAVYLWHCDAEGAYSLYDKTDRNYLRGVGISDAKGQIKFTTIFPACYAGRWPHMHFEVFADPAAASTGSNSMLISQFALPKAACAALYAADPLYQASVANFAQVALASDNVFRDNTAEQIAAQTLALTGDATQGYKASVTIGLAVA